MKILIAVGTRPNFVKVTQFKKVAREMGDCDVKIVHTGQHYDRFMSGVFFDQFNLHPDYFLALEAGNPAAQLGEITTKMANLIATVKPDIILVPGNGNSTLAAALAANKSGVPLGHLESGLRSFDKTESEEINRVVTDELSTIHFATEEAGCQNLTEAGIDNSTVHFVGNTMIDTLVAYKEEIDNSKALEKLELSPSEYGIITMHKPKYVDNSQGLTFLANLLETLCDSRKYVLPLHPRTKKYIDLYGIRERLDKIENLKITWPLGYFAMQRLVRDSAVVITDSGGLQEESTFHGVPCLTLGDCTERPVTVEVGTNTLVPLDLDAITKAVKAQENRKGAIPKLWDGRATERILNILVHGKTKLPGEDVLSKEQLN